MSLSTDTSNPTRFLTGQSGTDTRALSLHQFGGEVLAAFDLATVFRDKIQTKALPKGAKGWKFPKTWKATAEYHTPGRELMGTDIQTGEVTITPDDLLVSHTAIADLDEMLSHFDVSSQFSTELGRALARVYDKNAARQIILAARTASDGPFPGGSAVASDTLKASGSPAVYNGAAWVAAIRAANEALFDKDVPEELPRMMVVNSMNLFNAIKYAKDSDGNYIVLDRDLNPDPGAAGGVRGRNRVLEIDGVTIIPSRNMPNTNETADVNVYPKYRADFSKTLAVMWCPMAAAAVNLRDVTLETTRDVRRQENFMVASMLSGFGTLRPECAYEFASAT
jgi:hypothetical protein